MYNIVSIYFFSSSLVVLGPFSLGILYFSLFSLFGRFVGGISFNLSFYPSNHLGVPYIEFY